MTREEHIEQLELMLRCPEYNLDDNDRETIKVCIKALEQEPCEDAISRDKAIVQLSHLLSDWDDDWNVGIRKCIETVKNVSSVTPQQRTGRWIPVSERLPEKGGDYLVTQKATFSDYVYISVIGYALNLHDVDEYDFAEKRPGWYVYDIEWGFYEIDDVIAWMPLPLPWKGE